VNPRTVVYDTGMILALLGDRPAALVLAAALHAPAQVITSDPGDINAYAATLDRADITVEQI
jgi:hypothetical protein